jgi:hypothetical protein
VKKSGSDGVDKDVLFVEHGDDVNDETDAARDAKHDRAQQLEHPTDHRWQLPRAAVKIGPHKPQHT